MTKPYYQDKWVTIYHGDCREILPSLDKGSAIVTDPPYELGFMGKVWDSKGISFQKETWQVIRNACKSGAMLLSFGGTRTFHRIACAIEDAGFEYRDTIMWVYGSGFPKSLDISKAIDKQFGAKRKVVGKYKQTIPQISSRTNFGDRYGDEGGNNEITISSTPQAQLWEGYGTALKPAYEPIIVAMNPLDGTFAENALKRGVAGLNIDGCRIPTDWDSDPTKRGWQGGGNRFRYNKSYREIDRDKTVPKPQGRFPANFIHDGSQAVMELFPNTKSGNLNIGHKRGKTEFYGGGIIQRDYGGDSGSVARFFYCAKASKKERDMGLEEITTSQGSRPNSPDPTGKFPEHDHRIRGGNNHPTVKPRALMEYLVKLVRMPEYNLIIDPFMGSGTTLLACIRLGIPCIGIDNDEHTCEIAAKRCSQSVMEMGV